MDDTVFSELTRKRSDRFPSAPAQLSRRDFGKLPDADTEPHRQCYPFLAQAVVDARNNTRSRIRLTSASSCYSSRASCSDSPVDVRGSR